MSKKVGRAEAGKGSDYVPLTLEALSASPIEAEHEFRISSESHARHIAYLEKLQAIRGHAGHACTPFEMWGLPRTLSAAGFLRLNEVVALSGRWLISADCIPLNALICSKVAFESGTVRSGLAIGRFRGCTAAHPDGPCLLRFEDRILLLRSSNHQALRNAFERANGRDETARLARCSWVTLAGPWPLGFRFPWRDEDWKNNIHTESFARSLGLEGPLVEAQVLLDLLYFLGREYLAEGSWEATLLTYRCHAPLLAGREVEVLGPAEAGKSRPTFLLAGMHEERVTIYMTVTLEPMEDPRWPTQGGQRAF